MRTKTRPITSAAFLLLSLLSMLSTINSQLPLSSMGATCTCQGWFTEGANPATGIYDWRFAACDAPVLGT